MAKVTVELNDRLLEAAAGLFREKTKSELITIALVELVDKYEQKNLYDLFYSDEILISESYDYKAKRGGSLEGGVDILVDSEESLSDGEGNLSDGAGDFGYSEGGLSGNEADFGYSEGGFGGNESDFGHSETGFNDNAVDFSYDEAGFSDEENI